MPGFRAISQLCLWTAFALLTTSTALAENVKVEGVHLCCGACVKAVNQSLANVEGVSQVSVNKDEEIVTFNAADDAAAQRGLTALTGAGFYGTSSVPGPDFTIDADKNGNEVHISKVHLCCGGCVKAVEASLKKVNGVTSIETQAKQGTITLKGENINLAATLKALHDTGFHGKVE